MNLLKKLTQNLKKSKKGQGLVELLVITAVLGTLSIVVLTSLSTTLSAKNTQVLNKIDNGITNSID